MVPTPRHFVLKCRYKGTERVWLDEINCNGTEDDIYKCGSDGWGMSDCGHSKDVSVICGM